jgi:hypothetical protein
VALVVVKVFSSDQLFENFFVDRLFSLATTDDNSAIGSSWTFSANSV